MARRRRTSDVTLADVAQLSGVSAQTVSRVFNNSTAVKESTRLKVVHAAEELGYQPNMSARALASGKTGLIGVLLIGMLHFGNSEIIAALEVAFREHGYSLILATAPSKTEAEVRETYRQLRASKIEAMVVILGTAEAFIPVLRNEGGFKVPTVLLAANDMGLEGASVVGCKQAQGVRAAIQQFKDQNVRSAIHISGKLSSDDGVVRLSAFLQACEELGIVGTWYAASDWSVEAGYDAAKKVLEQQTPKAVLAGNDSIAIGAMRAFSEHGLQARKDYIITGFDNDAVDSYLPISLSSIHQDFPMMGQVMLEEITKLMAGSEPSVRLVDAPLKVRESSVFYNVDADRG